MTNRGDTAAGKGWRRVIQGAAMAVAFAAAGLAASGLPAVAQGMMALHGGTAAQAHIDKMLVAVDATPDQKTRIEAILTGATGSMTTVHTTMESAHGDLLRLLTAPTIDRGALETLRAAHLAELDQATRTMTSALADAVEVLTPEQRAKLARLMGGHGGA